MFSIDGVEYAVECSITRTAEIRASDISGLMMNGYRFWDILGTYMIYDVTLTMPLRNKARYHALIEQLTEPVESHDFTLPYNAGTVQLVGKVNTPEDVWEKLPSGYSFWKGLKFTVEANYPTKQPTLAGAIARGLPALPPVNTADIGDTYTMTADGWENAEDLPDADLIQFPRT